MEMMSKAPHSDNGPWMNGDQWVKYLRMQFTAEVDWTATDFIFAAIILGGTGLVFEITVRRIRNNAYRAGMMIALLAGFLLTWSNAAVGFIGSGANIANVLYFAVLAICVSGCFVAGFQAKGMSMAMVATATAQGLVTLLATVSGMADEDGVIRILMINAVFIGLWLFSAMLFRKAADQNA
jgi:hypothetical protein